MVAQCRTVAFQGIQARNVTVEAQFSAGLPSFTVVGLPDKAVNESRERVRGVLATLGLALPPKRITVNLAPADLLKEGSHFDLPIAVAILAAMGALPADEAAQHVVLGELSLNGAVLPVGGVLPAAIEANRQGLGLICPAAQGGEAAWSGNKSVLAAPSLLALINHFKGSQILRSPEPGLAGPSPDQAPLPDLFDVKGQETAKRVLELSAAGGHNLLMTGPPGAGKSMLAQRLPGLLPPLDAQEALEVSSILSVAGMLKAGEISQIRPFRSPHHSCSVAALVGGGLKARPGEISLAHRGVLFLDELPEFNRAALESLRQPLETGTATVARANAHLTYPARFQLIAAMNPCRCGHLSDATRACSRAPVCGEDYQAKISGPLLDRIDLYIDVPPVAPADLSLSSSGETSATVRERVVAVRTLQKERFERLTGLTGSGLNADADGAFLMQIARPDDTGQALLLQASERLGLSARGYHRILKVARTLADLEGSESVKRLHIAEALSFRQGLANKRRRRAA